MSARPGTRPKLAVHKFSSCDGCQLSLLNLGEVLLELPGLVDIVHFAEAGPIDEEQPVDVALVEGSISTTHDLERIQKIRANSGFLISIGACATAGGLQALRNMADAGAWSRAIYASPEHLDSLDTATAIAGHVKVDLEIWGCPVNSRQVVSALRDLLSGVSPRSEQRPVCMECKRRGVVCTLVTGEAACMGPVTRGGCGALCPSFGRACYACYGPAEQVNAESLGRRFEGFGLLPVDIARKFHFITSAAPPFQAAGEAYRNRADAVPDSPRTDRNE
jgi:coenzyme F420-reducing hydrogenase gamma subunit